MKGQTIEGCDARDVSFIKMEAIRAIEKVFEPCPYRKKSRCIDKTYCEKFGAFELEKCRGVSVTVIVKERGRWRDWLSSLFYLLLR